MEIILIAFLYDEEEDMRLTMESVLKWCWKYEFLSPMEFNIEIIPRKKSERVE